MTEHSIIADVLDDAADLIERDGWFNDLNSAYKGGAGPKRHCAMTSIGAVSEKMSREWNAALDTLATFIGAIDAAGIPNWNDGFDNPQPVLDTMRKCAKELRRMDDLG